MARVHWLREVLDCVCDGVTHNVGMFCEDWVGYGVSLFAGIVRLKREGTSLREKAGFKGKQSNGVGTQLMKRERQVIACTELLQCYYYDVHTSPASA
jgi:hypothetical protein